MTKEDVELAGFSGCPDFSGASNFDPDEFLASIPKPEKKQSKIKVVKRQCPRCMVDLKFGVTKRKDGTNFKYYRCPMTCFDTKCYVTCRAEDIDEYLSSVQNQTHPCYARIDPFRFRCECNASMVLSMSK